MSQMLETALEAAKRAQSVIMEYYARKEVLCQHKEDSSIVTEADRQAEQTIKETIRHRFPDHGFFGEEFGKENAQAEYVWVIDPIDGTNNFFRKIPIFATQIGLMRGNEFILGVSNAPALDELMWAEKGKGAFLNGVRVQVSSVCEIENSYLSYGHLKYFIGSDKISQLEKLSTETFTARGYGDFWSYHLVAQGKLEAVVEAKVKLYDVAAMICIIEEAGGRVTGLDGMTISDDSTSIVATNSKTHDRILEYFNNSSKINEVKPD